MKTLKLSDFVENPKNPQTVTPEDFARLVAKIRRNPDGLRAQRIAYVTDNPAGRFVVLAGNKRLRALKLILGADASIPADYTQDITHLSAESRTEFLVNSNICEGTFDADRLLADYGEEALAPLMSAEQFGEIVNAVKVADEVQAEAAPPEPKTVDLRFTLSPSDYGAVVANLRLRNRDISAAFEEVINEHA